VGEHVTELRLPSGAHQEHDKGSCDLQRHFVAMIFFHQRERPIDPGGDSR
jgi:hypothetical protein